MTAVLMKPPAVEPVLLGEARAYLRLSNSDDDDLVSALISAARIHVERMIRQVLIDQEWKLFFDVWPEDNVIRLTLNPIKSVKSIVIHTGHGCSMKLSDDDYVLDKHSFPARIMAVKRSFNPSSLFSGVEVDVSVGYGNCGTQVPQPLRLAIMMLATRWYECRDGAFVIAVPSDINDTFNALISPYRMIRI